MKRKQILALLFILMLLIISSSCTQKANTSSTPTSTPQSPVIEDLLSQAGYPIPTYITYSGKNYSLTMNLIAAIKIPDDLSPHGRATDFTKTPIQLGYAGYDIYVIKNTDVSQAIAVQYIAPYKNSLYYYFVEYNRVTTPIP